MKLIFHFIGNFTFIFWTAFFIVFLLLFQFPQSSLLFILPSQQQFIHCSFQPHFLGAFIGDGSTCFIYVISTSFLLLNILLQKFHQSSMCSSFIGFFTPIFQCQFLVTCHTHRPILVLLVAVIS